MKVLDLHCGNGHGFEGWFASEDDFQVQLARGLLTCPVCNDTAIVKRLSAPRLNLGGASAGPASDQKPLPAGTPDLAAQAAWLKMVRHVVANTEDVGDRFAEMARRMHHGEASARNIRGNATRKETEALLDEGIAVLPLPVPDALKEPLQ